MALEQGGLASFVSEPSLAHLPTIPSRNSISIALTYTMKLVNLVPGALALSYALFVDVADAKKTVLVYKVPSPGEFPSILSQLPSDMKTEWLNVRYDRQDWHHKYQSCDNNIEVFYWGDASSRE
jgi:hypothetical protein